MVQGLADLVDPPVRNGWGLDDALTLIRRLQKTARLLGYHIALGGGVLNKGTSEKDLDLYFLPLVDHKPEFLQLIQLLELEFGTYTDIGSGGADLDNIYKDKLQYVNGGKRVDVFVVAGGN